MWKLTFLVLFLPLSAFSQNYSFVAMYGMETRYERDQNQNFTDRRFNNWDLGFGLDNFYFISEYGKFESSSGNNTLLVGRTVESYSLWALYEQTATNWLKFYVSGGLGVYQEKIDTYLLSIKTTDRGPNKNMGGAGLGLRFPFGYLWLSLEARILFMENWDPNPTTSFIGRLGLRF